MNLTEETLTNWWSKFLFEFRGYDVMFRNLTIINEFDCIGVSFTRGISSDVRLENIETKWADPYTLDIERARRRLYKQLNKNRDLHIFNTVLGASNDLKVFDYNLPAHVGYIFMGNPKNGVPFGKIMKEPQSLPIHVSKRDRIIRSIRQVFPIIKLKNRPKIFSKCQKKGCNFVYAFDWFEPPPEPSSTELHSDICFMSPQRTKRYKIGTVDLTMPGIGRFTVIRFNNKIS